MITIYTNFAMTSISVWTGNSEDTNLYFHMEQMKTCVPEAEPRFNINTVFPRYGIPMWKIRRPWDRLIFNMGIPILTSLFWSSSQISRYWCIHGYFFFISDTYSINTKWLPHSNGSHYNFWSKLHGFKYDSVIHESQQIHDFKYIYEVQCHILHI